MFDSQHLLTATANVVRATTGGDVEHEQKQSQY